MTLRSKTDAKGRAILLFMGEILLRLEDAKGNTIMDHWDNNGKASTKL